MGRLETVSWGRFGGHFGPYFECALGHSGGVFSLMDSIRLIAKVFEQNGYTGVLFLFSYFVPLVQCHVKHGRVCGHRSTRSV